MKIYLAGKYSSDNVLGVLHNIREGVKTAAKLVKDGHSVFCPFLDHQLAFYEDLSVEDFQRNSIAFLEDCEIIYILPNSENSKGTQKEIERAKELGIPIHYL